MKLVILTEEERKRLLDLVSQPNPPGPEHTLDVQLMFKLGFKGCER